MTNEEKAKEILSCHKCPFRTDRPHKIDIGEDACAVCFDYKAVMGMAEWKDEQLETEKQALINKACEWLEHNVWEYTGFDSYELSEAFKKAMKGGNNE